MYIPSAVTTGKKQKEEKEKFTVSVMQLNSKDSDSNKTL